MKLGPLPGTDFPEGSPAREERVTEAAEHDIVSRLRRLGALAAEVGAPTVERDSLTLAERVAGGGVSTWPVSGSSSAGNPCC
jgi:hypothetical protein